MGKEVWRGVVVDREKQCVGVGDVEGVVLMDVGLRLMDG